MRKINLPTTGINRFLSQTQKGTSLMNVKRIFLTLIITGMMVTMASAQSDEIGVQANDRFDGRAAQQSHGITGSWEGVVTAAPGGPPPFRVVMTFTGVGGFIGSGDGDNSVGSPQYGVWERTGRRRFALTFRQLFSNPDASSNGSVKVRQTIILSKSGNEWRGPFKVDIFAPDGTLVFSGDGTAQATRIRSEPLP